MRVTNMRVVVMGFNEDVRRRLSSWGYAHKIETDLSPEQLLRLAQDFDVMFSGHSVDRDRCPIMWLDTKGNQFQGGFRR